MRRLTCIREREQGAVATIVAMLFFFGVMLALGALTVDVGNINADRRQLQNGADAASLSAARDCITTECPSLTGSLTAQANYGRLVVLANNNAADGATKLARVDSGLTVDAADPRAVCGTLPGLPACAVGTDSSKLQECPASPFPSAKYVRVYTQTLNAGKTATLLPYSFGAAIAGVGSGANQQACASVAMRSGYGAPAAVADARCAWEAATGAKPRVYPPVPPDFPALPPYFYPSSLISDPPNASPPGPVPVAAKYVVKVGLQGTGTATEDESKCGKTVSGQYYPGNFGWLDVKSGTTCTADLSSDDKTVGGSSGGPPPSQGSADCSAYLDQMVGSIIYIPIFTSMVPGLNGGNAEYKLDGVSAFFLAGWQAPSGTTGPDHYSPLAYDPTNDLNPTVHCTKTGKDHDGGCLWGWYLKDIVPAGNISEGTSRGPIILGLNG